MFRFIDAHTHAQFAAYDADRDEVIRRALEAGIAMVNVGTNAETSEAAVRMTEKYQEGEAVVVIICASSFFNMATGMNNSMIFFTDKYALGSWMLIGLIVVSVALNILIIPIWGMEGAALVTGSCLFFSNIFKTAIIYTTYKLQPFGKYVWMILLLTAIVFAVNNLLLPALDNKILDIAYRSFIITIIYSIGIYTLSIAPEMNEVIRKIFLRMKKGIR